MGRKVVDLRSKKPGISRGAPRSTREARRVSPLRVWRRKVRLYSVVLALAALIGVLPYLSDLTYHERVSLGEVRVEGAKRVSSNLIKALFNKTLYDGAYHALSRSNIFWYPKAELEAELTAGIPRLKAASLKREGLLAQAVTILVEERKRYGVWCAVSGACYEIDDTGFIFSALPERERGEGSIIFSGVVAGEGLPVGKTYLGAHMQKITAFLELLEKKKLKPLNVVSDGDVDYWVELANGMSLRVALTSDPIDAARNLELALTSDALRGAAESIEYIDLRFGNKLYYKTR